MAECLLKSDKGNASAKTRAKPTHTIVMPLFVAALACAAWCVSSPAALAHGLNVWAHAHDGTIHGEASFADGSPVADAPVIVRDADGHELGKTTTNTYGEFSFIAKVRADHHFLVNAGEGHAARCVVAVADLPTALPPPEHAHQAETPHDRGHRADHDHGAEDSRPPASLGSLAHEIESLRRQVAQLERTTRFRDVLGGVGFIFGLAGVAFYFLAKQKGNASGSQSDASRCAKERAGTEPQMDADGRR